MSDRWEFVVGKALKDWTTAVMLEKKITRAEAREFVLGEIRSKCQTNVNPSKSSPTLNSKTTSGLSSPNARLKFLWSRLTTSIGWLKVWQKKGEAHETRTAS